MDLTFLEKKTSSVMVAEVKALIVEFQEQIENLNIEQMHEWVIVKFVLGDNGFCYQYNRNTGEYDSWFMPLDFIGYFSKIIVGRALKKKGGAINEKYMD